MSLLIPLAAVAHDGHGRFNEHTEDTSGSGGGNSRALDATAGVTFTTTNAGNEGSGPLTSSDPSWTPPACYYAPRFTPMEFKTDFEEYAYGSPHHSGKAEAVRWHEDTYGPDSEYNDHNVDKEGEGMWWDSFINHDSNDSDAKLSCGEPVFWVEFGDSPPDFPGVLTPELLARLAYARTEVPRTDIELSPQEAQTVNLPTWVWLDASEFTPVEVTASVEAYGIWATTRATPVSLALDAGTEEADLHPRPGECVIAADGTIGEPYVRGRAGESPPCGVTYLRATHARGPYSLTASLTWEVEWEGSDGSGGTLPDGVFETAHEIVVGEVQTIVR